MTVGCTENQGGRHPPRGCHNSRDSCMTFAAALKSGRPMRRPGDFWIELDDSNRWRLHGSLSIVVLSRADYLANDWEVLS